MRCFGSALLEMDVAGKVEFAKGTIGSDLLYEIVTKLLAYYLAPYEHLPVSATRVTCLAL